MDTQDTIILPPINRWKPFYEHICMIEAQLRKEYVQPPDGKPRFPLVINTNTDDWDMTIFDPTMMQLLDHTWEQRRGTQDEPAAPLPDAPYVGSIRCFDLFGSNDLEQCQVHIRPLGQIVRTSGPIYMIDGQNVQGVGLRIGRPDYRLECAWKVEDWMLDRAASEPDVAKLLTDVLRGKWRIIQRKV